MHYLLFKISEAVRQFPNISSETKPMIPKSERSGTSDHTAAYPNEVPQQP
jgi:hypothetical protein